MRENQFFAVVYGFFPSGHLFFAQTPPFCQIIIKSVLPWLEYTNKNLWDDESPTSATKYGLTVTFKHHKRQNFKK